MQFLGIDSVQLDWTDAPDSELGYIIRKTVNGGTPEVIAELPTGAINPIGPDSYLELLVPRDARRSVQIHGAVSTNLTSWNVGEPHCTVVEDETDHVLFRSATPVGDVPRQFIRAEVAEP